MGSADDAGGATRTSGGGKALAALCQWLQIARRPHLETAAIRRRRARRVASCPQTARPLGTLQAQSRGVRRRWWLRAPRRARAGEW